MTAKKGNEYKAYDREYQARPEQVKKRVARNAARRDFMRDGLVRKGDGKDVDHVKQLEHGGSNHRSNLRVVDRSTNRGKNKT
jgi:hypothetical protein